ncbi:MAG: nucleotide exchange factor GrpE [Alloprevotella sp.]
MTNDKEKEIQENISEEAVNEQQAPTPDTDNTDTQTAEDAEASAEPQAEKTDAEKLEEAEAEIASLKDQLLRKAAEFENFRKRTIKEKTELILNGGRRVIEALLPVLDDLERAQDNMGKATDVEALKEGVDLILSKLDKTLSGQGLKKIDTTDALFDTDFHEAIAMVPAADDSQKGKVIDCVQTGYMLGETVIRHAKVAVGQ